MRWNRHRLCSLFAQDGFLVATSLRNSWDVKEQESGATHPERNTQFEYIQTQKKQFPAANCPIISVDTKKKELIGNSKNAGQAWKKQLEAVKIPLRSFETILITFVEPPPRQG